MCMCSCKLLSSLKCNIRPICIKLLTYFSLPSRAIFKERRRKESRSLFMNGSRSADVKALVQILNINNYNKQNLNSFAFISIVN